MNKRVFLFLLLLLGRLGDTLSPLQAQPSRKKVAVVLSGGGAKGVAHVKALKVIEEAGIPVDYIVGTSMGAIVGGLYAIGYTPNQLDSLVRKQDWSFILSDRIRRRDMSLTEREQSDRYILSLPFVRKKQTEVFGGMIQGQNLSNLFSELTMGYHDSIDFNRLPIPFACVATNIVDGREIVFHNGELGTAMRASMAIPGVFTPVRTDSMVLVDGGITNNFPVDIAKAMGADLIIGVDVQDRLKTADKLNSMPDMIKQIIDLTCQSNYRSHVEQTDVHIKVDVTGYSSASFNPVAIDTLLKRGEEASRRQWDNLLTLKEKIGLTPNDPLPVDHPYFAPDNTKELFIDKISFVGTTMTNKEWLMKKCHLNEHRSITTQQIEKALNLLRGNQSFSGASYKLTPDEKGYHLTFFIEEKYEKKINLGVRFDSEEIATLLLNATARLKTKRPSRLSLTARLGKRYAAQVDYTLETLHDRFLTFSYRFQNNDFNLYEESKRAYNLLYRQQQVTAEYSNLWFKNLRFAIGVQFDYYYYNNILLRIPEEVELRKTDRLFNYYFKISHDTYDSGYFPTKGSRFNACFTVHTDNLSRYRNNNPFISLNASWEKAFPVTRRFSVLPSVYGRLITGDDLPYMLNNAIGGNGFGYFLAHQVPLAGMPKSEIVNQAVVISTLKFRQRMGKNHYLTLSGSYGYHNEKIRNLMSGEMLAGASLTYSLMSPIGPLDLSLGYSNHYKKANSFINIGYRF